MRGEIEEKSVRAEPLINVCAYTLFFSEGIGGNRITTAHPVGV
jgi:hypothetical protein